MNNKIPLTDKELLQFIEAGLFDIEAPSDEMMVIGKYFQRI